MFGKKNELSEKEKKELEDFKTWKKEKDKKEKEIQEEEIEEIESEEEDIPKSEEKVTTKDEDFFDVLSELVEVSLQKGTSAYQINNDMMYLVSQINQQIYEKDGTE